MVLRLTFALALAAAVLPGPGTAAALSAQVTGALTAGRRAPAAVEPGWLGLAFDLASVPEVRSARDRTPATSVTVRYVFPDGPAARAGVRAGDRVVAIDRGAVDVRSLGPGSLIAGDTVQLDLQRTSGRIVVRIEAEPLPDATGLLGQLPLSVADLERFEVRVDSARQILLERVAEFEAALATRERDRRTSTAARAPAAPVAGPAERLREGSLVAWTAGEDRVAGARFIAMPPELAAYFGVERGLLVESVADGTPADRAGLVPGDVLTHVSGAPVADVTMLRRLVAAGRDVGLGIVRRGRRLDLRLPS